MRQTPKQVGMPELVTVMANGGTARSQGQV